jgi:ABC-type multidrug transport system fused ATPase/permease subunit
MGLLIEMITIPLVFTLIVTSLMSLKAFIDLYLSQEVFYNLYTIVYSKLQRLPLTFFQKNSVGDVMYRLTDDVQVIEDMILTTVPKVVASTVRLTLILSLCFSINVKLTLLALVSVPLYFATVMVFAEKRRQISIESNKKNAELYSVLEERLSHIKLVKLYHKWAEELRYLLSQVSGVFHVERKEKAAAVLSRLSSTFLNRSWAFVVALYMGVSIINDAITLGEVVALTALFALLNAPFNTMGQLYMQFKTSQVSFDRILEILDTPEEREPEKQKATEINGSICFENVSFAYESSTPLLKELSFQVGQGESLAIVGKSGIGKSSIIDLLLRFYEIQTGSICIDDIPIEDISLATLRGQVSVVSHDAPIFKASIHDNIAFSSPKKVTHEAVKEAAKRAGIHDFIDSLPEKYNTQLGPKGTGLSSGQKQRLAIARALLTHPKVLVFDEATSALDPETEQVIHHCIKTLKGNTTVLIVAHRLSMIQCVDNIVVLGPDGSVVEQGKVLDLMNNKGVFYKLYEIQLGGFHQCAQHIKHMIGSVKLHKRDSCVGLFHVSVHKVDDPVLKQKLLSEFSLMISFLLRESDTCFYQESGRWWITMPETDLGEAERLSRRLGDYLNSVQLDEEDPSGHLFTWVIEKCRKDDTESSLMASLEEELDYCLMR